MAARSGYLQRSFHFSDRETMERFIAWCKERGIAPGHAIQILVGANLRELELQKDQIEVTLQFKEVKFV